MVVSLVKGGGDTRILNLTALEDDVKNTRDLEIGNFVSSKKLAPRRFEWVG